ncbi:MAG: cell division protein FtsH, partial [Syntrophobacteraceae bacterium]|nr:cell division protein FtsH [Syntrophobacteraceae bacterium]
MEKTTKFSIWYVVAAVWGVLLLQDFIASQYQPRHIPYSEFLKALKGDQIIEVVITEGALAGKMRVTEEGQTKEVRFRTFRVDADLSSELAQHNVVFRGQPENTFIRDIISWTLPALIFFGVWYLLMRRMGANTGAGIMSFGRNKAKVFAEKEIQTRFEDVAGADEAKAELQ